MTRFVIDQPISTDQPTIVVDAGLRPGRHRFRLVVVDSAGRESRADEVLVEVSDRTPGTPVTPITPISPVTPLRPIAGAAPIAAPTPSRRKPSRSKR